MCHVVINSIYSLSIPYKQGILRAVFNINIFNYKLYFIGYTA